MQIVTQRIYEDHAPAGYRVLVDRLWPRGISKEDAALDDWWKDLAPSDGLRKWFQHEPEKWAEFRKEYKRELAAHRAEAETFLHQVKKKKLVLLYGAKSQDYNHALVLKDYLEALQGRA